MSKMIIKTEDGEITFSGSGLWDGPSGSTILYNIEVGMEFHYMGRLYEIKDTELYFQGVVPFMEAISTDGAQYSYLFEAEQLMGLIKNHLNNRNQSAIEAVKNSGSCHHLNQVKRQSVVFLEVYEILRCKDCGIEIK